ncbi:GAF domain-containing protein [Phytohabitans suffuscus]|uniref:GAF domain-containing protein n=1 Tax=Phytohabitans suffuscus TaxID=624315 RepID=A0A6F8Y9W4_9ACTN|nr:GAF domain-containing protein [Phytohabitans suffuscus]BCB82896.1 hypothetical protein Psuf_002090 [Phytohabitans suffuscus]
MNESTHDAILRSTVRLARLSFRAAAASVFLLNRERDELVFEAASGAGEDRLVGVSIPPGKGIAGWVATTGETIIVREADTDSRFDRRFAEGTGYVPTTILAAPLEERGVVIGVLEVLDPSLDEFGDIAAMDLLSELSIQSCAALSLLLDDRGRQHPARTAGADLDALAVLLRGLDGQRAAAAGDIVAGFLRLLAARP